MTSSPDLQELDRMRPPAEARRIISSHLPRLATEHVPLMDAIGRILAEDIVAPENHPPFPASTMDGFAVVAEDVSPWRQILGTQNAGDTIDEEVTEGYTVRIMTGAALPTGANAVVPVEATTIMEDGHVVIHQEDVAVGENVRPVGSDVAMGDRVLPAGLQLGPAEIGLVASMGIDPVPVARRPRVSVLSTGDELVEPDQPLTPGHIRDSNRFSLVAALRREPVEITWVGKAPDDREALEAFLRERMATDDIIITSGGVSMGERDLIKAILFEADDVEIHFRRLYMKPGKPLNFATKGDTLIFGLPGNPVSSLVTFELFIRTAIREMMGATEVDRPILPVRLVAGTSPSDRIEYQRGIVSIDSEGKLIARSTGMQRSSRLASFLGANALLVIAPREIDFAPGEIVNALMLSAPYAENANP
ncbi:MAG TPA: gephyrin-like molybdotransferase Glp [Thermomicrobiales bacterium]|nr:gephyrin-like molybdotransferase Glp [Thermomicrobiales bacterium]